LGADPETLSYQVDDATFLPPLPARANGLTESDRPWIVVTVHPVGEPGVGNPVITRLVASLRTIANTAEAELVFLPHVNFPRESGAIGDGAFGEAIKQALNGDPPIHILPVLPAAQTMWLTMLEETARSRRFCDESAENRRVTELEMAGLKSELVDAKARLASAYLSRSWRLTAPLRWCDEIQRRVVRRLRRVSRR
jgi:hypothetical protein